MSNDSAAVAAADVLLTKDSKVLLNLRAGDIWGAGYYGIPGGHVESGEDFETTAVREMEEELGVAIKKEDLVLVHVMYRPAGSDGQNRINLKFVCERWSGEPRNVETDKSDAILWIKPQNPPKNTLPHELQTLECYRAGIPASVFDGYATGTAKLD